MNRVLLRQLADARIAEAAILLAGGGFAGAYYLVGYAVECGLKSCVLAHVDATGEIFRDKKFSEKCWTHDLKSLVELAGLKTAHENEMRGDAAFARNWSEVKDWTEISRYELRSHSEAQLLFDAITDPAHGLLPWIKRHW